MVRYPARHGESRVAKAVLISSVPLLMVKTEGNPGGLPKEVFDGFQAQIAARQVAVRRDLLWFNRPGVEASEAVIENWWRQGMMGAAKAHYDGIVAFSQTDFTEELQKISVPVLVMHGDDDQIVPYADSGPLSAKLVKNGTHDLQRFPARHANHASGDHQRRSTDLPESLTSSPVIRHVAQWRITGTIALAQSPPRGSETGSRSENSYASD